MKKKCLKLMAPMLLVALLVSCSRDALNDLDQSLSIELNGATNEMPFKTQVDLTMLKSYLKLTKRLNNVKEIVPMKDNGEVLAYIVQYEDGWDMISADTRCCPILASSDEGIIDLNAQDPGTQSVWGMLSAVRNIQNDEKAKLDPMWALFVPKQEVKNDPSSSQQGKHRGLRGNRTSGMWIPVDTIYDYDNTDSGHKISTAWGQGSPWNNYVRYKYNNGILTHCKTGCVAVAAAQIIAYFRMSNNRSIAIPTSATLPFAANQDMSITSSSTNGWSSIQSDHDGSVAQMFIAKIGIEVNSTWGIEKTTASSLNVAQVFSDYLLDYYLIDYTNNTISGTVGTGNGIAYVSANHKYLQIFEDDHAFIIDRNGRQMNSVAIQYEWDPNHYPTWEEEQRLPGWMLQPMYGDHGEELTEYMEYQVYTERQFIGMNWGWGGVGNNITYTTLYTTTPPEDMPSEYIPGNTGYYSIPNWSVTYNGDTYIFNNVKLTYVYIREH